MYDVALKKPCSSGWFCPVSGSPPAECWEGGASGKLSSLLPKPSARRLSSLRAIRSTINRYNADAVGSGKKSPVSESANILITQGGQVLGAVA